MDDPVAASCSRSCPDRAPRSRSTGVAQIKPAAKDRPTRSLETLDALVFALVPHHGYTLSRAFIEEGVTLSRECGHELAHVYLLSHRARLELNQGQWEAAAEFAEFVLGKRLVSTFPRSLALVTLALVRARRGDPDVWSLLDEARDLSEPTGELLRIAPVAAARGEAAWLSGRSADVAAETDAAFELALSRPAPWALGELAVIRRRAGIEDVPPKQLPEPHMHEVEGRWREAATAWRKLGHPYEAALALGEGDEGARRDALEELRSLAAGPAARIVARRLRQGGLRRIPVGPRTSTRTNPAGLTARELEVLEPDGRGFAKRRDRRAAVPLPPYRGSSRFRRAAQARCEDSRRGGSAGATAKPARVPVTAPRKLGGPADVPSTRHT